MQGQIRGGLDDVNVFIVSVVIWLSMFWVNNCYICLLAFMIVSVQMVSSVKQEYEMVFKIRFWVMALFTIASLAPAVSYAAEDKVIAVIGDKEITTSDLAGAVRDIGARFESIPEDRRKAALLDALIDIVAISELAETDGFGKDEAFIARMKLLRQRALHNVYVSKTISEKITDEEVKSRFELETSKVEQIKARHILVKTEDEANEIIKMLDDGADFVELAKKKSTGPSGPNGGDLGFFGKGQMVPEFEKAAFALEIGKYTAKAAKTQFGYHIIKLEERRTAPPPEYEALKAKFRQIILREKYGDLIKSTREKLKVKILDESLNLPKQSN